MNLDFAMAPEQTEPVTHRDVRGYRSHFLGSLNVCAVELDLCLKFATLGHISDVGQTRLKTTQRPIKARFRCEESMFVHRVTRQFLAGEFVPNDLDVAKGLCAMSVVIVEVRVNERRDGLIGDGSDRRYQGPRGGRGDMGVDNHDILVVDDD